MSLLILYLVSHLSIICLQIEMKLKKALGRLIISYLINNPEIINADDDQFWAREVLNGGIYYF